MTMTRREQEIQTIAPRQITLNLSAADCERIAADAGACGLTVANLLENFIGDLVGGTYTNGSDERDYARRYVERCWFSNWPSESLLQKLLRAGEELKDIERLLDAVDDLAVIERDLVNAGDDEERQSYLEDMKDVKQEIACFTDYYPDMTDFAAEIEKCRRWVDEVHRLEGRRQP